MSAEGSEGGSSPSPASPLALILSLTSFLSLSPFKYLVSLAFGELGSPSLTEMLPTGLACEFTQSDKVVCLV